MVKVINIDTKTRTIRVENAADGDIKTWRTTESGAHFPIKKGESTKEALDKFVASKRKGSDDKRNTDEILAEEATRQLRKKARESLTPNQRKKVDLMSAFKSGKISEEEFMKSAEQIFQKESDKFVEKKRPEATPKTAGQLKKAAAKLEKAQKKQQPAKKEKLFKSSKEEKDFYKKYPDGIARGLPGTLTPAEVKKKAEEQMKQQPQPRDKVMPEAKKEDDYDLKFAGDIKKGDVVSAGGKDYKIIQADRNWVIGLDGKGFTLKIRPEFSYDIFKVKKQPAKKDDDKELETMVKAVEKTYGKDSPEAQRARGKLQPKKESGPESFKSVMQKTMKAFPRLYDFEKPHLEEFANKVYDDIQNNPGKEKEVLEHLADAYKHHIAGLGPWVDTPTLAKKAFLDQMLESHLNKQSEDK